MTVDPTRVLDRLLSWTDSDSEAAASTAMAAEAVSSNPGLLLQAPSLVPMRTGGRPLMPGDAVAQASAAEVATSSGDGNAKEVITHSVATAEVLRPKSSVLCPSYSTAFPVSVRCCSGFSLAASELQGQCAVRLRLPDGYTSGHIPLDVAKKHGTSYIDDQLRRGSSALRFKIGITHRPVYRFEDGRGAYQPLGYHGMDVLSAADF